jgi:hypothetical protein
VITEDKDTNDYIIVKGYIHKIPLTPSRVNAEHNVAKKCFDCGKVLTFQEFCRSHPSLTVNKALVLWEDPILSVYCPNCFFNRPEKSFKVKRRQIKTFN